MCDHHDDPTTEGALHQSHPHGGPSRRSLLRGGVATAAVGALWPGLARAAGPAAGSARAVAAEPGLDGARLFRAAEHIHARGSEGTGSMTAQAAEASRHVDVMWFTDHDWREAGIGAPKVVHFNSLTEERLPPNAAWRWQRVTAGKLGQSDGGIETVDVSPKDPDRSGALFARAVGAKRQRASMAWYRTERDLRYSSRTPAHGQTWQIEVLLREASADAWGFARVGLSYHPATAGRPDALYYIEYRFGPFRQRSYSIERLVDNDLGRDDGDNDDGDDPTDHESEIGVLGVVWVPTQPGAYRTATLDFTQDIEQLFPGMIARDNSIRSLWLGATSRSRAPANVCFDYLRMDRIYGQEQFEDRRAITEELAQRYRDVVMYNGTEVSYAVHRHWLGGNIVLPTYGGTDRVDGDAPTRTELVQMINARGGFSVANHPFGTSDRKLSHAEARAEAAHIVQGLLDTDANGGLHGIEVFYRKRAGATLEDHWLLYRLAVRNGLVLTASGVSDNHGGRVDSWTDSDNHFVTGLFADDITENALLDAQRRGRAYASEIGSFEGQLDISLDQDVMGQIGIRPTKVSRRLTVQASALPPGSTVEVWTIPVDLGGVANDPGGVIARLPAAAFTNGTAGVDVDTRRDTAFAVMVRNAEGVRVAGSNPVWHLKAEPRWTIPDERRAT